MLTLDPYLPLALWVPLALAAAALLAWYALQSRGRLKGWRRGAVLGLMSVAVAIPLFILLNPTWQQRVPPPPGKPLLTILVDRSASMATRDGENGQPRYETAARIAAAARELEDRYEVRVRTFAGDSSLASPETLKGIPPAGQSTDVAAAIEDSLKDEQPQGQAILLLSDGGHNASGGSDRLRQTAARAKAMAAPIYAKTLGGQGTVRDLAIELQRPQELAFAGQQVPVIVGVRQRGAAASQTTLTLLLDGKEIARRSVLLKPDATAEEIFQVTQKVAGLYRYELRVDPLPGEVTSLNNAASLLVRVIDQPVRVLLLEGKPYWDSKFLVRTLSQDESVELTSVVQLAAGRLLERKIARPKPASDSKPAPAAPPDQWTIEKDATKILSDADTLASYQIIILGRSAEVFLSDEVLARLKKWLAEGDGSLVCYRGPPSSQINQRLGELMPVRWTPGRESRFRVQLTEEGQARRWLSVSGAERNLLADMPSLATIARPEANKDRAEVLAASVSGGDSHVPVITCQSVGTGRVVVVEGAGMWRWAFLAPEHRNRDEVYGTLWRSMVRWLVARVRLLPSQRMALWTDHGTFSTEENVTATLLVRENQANGSLPQIELSPVPPTPARSASEEHWVGSAGEGTPARSASEKH